MLSTFLSRLGLRRCSLYQTESCCRALATSFTRLCVGVLLGAENLSEQLEKLLNRGCMKPRFCTFYLGPNDGYNLLNIKLDFSSIHALTDVCVCVFVLCYSVTWKETTPTASVTMTHSSLFLSPPPPHHRHMTNKPRLTG